jgi:hypothetical protein
MNEIALKVLSLNLRAMLIYLNEEPPGDLDDRAVVDSLQIKIAEAIRDNTREGMTLIIFGTNSEKERQEAGLFLHLAEAIAKSFGSTAREMRVLDRIAERMGTTAPLPS